MTSAVAAQVPVTPLRPVPPGATDVTMNRRADGALLLSSPIPLEPYPDKLTEKLVYWAQTTPDQAFLAWRPQPGAPWATLTYADALSKTRALAQALIDRKLSAEKPVAILSENSIEHALLALACMHSGVAYAPISPPYSLISSDFGKLRHTLELLTPGLVFATDGLRYEKALRVAAEYGAEIVVADNAVEYGSMTTFSSLLDTTPTAAVDAAFAKVGPDTIAKFLFTSGSTGMPKGVINTQRMMCSNLQMITQCFPLLAEAPPVMVDWLPWNHTFGGNHNFGMILYHGGTLYIDEGKPVPGAIETSVQNLREIAPTMYFNVPKGFEYLLPYLHREPDLRDKFFSRVRLFMYAGAGLPQPIWDELDELALQTCGERILMTTGLGCTESAPSALFANWDGGWAGLLGLPVPGLELKLVPTEGKLEARYRAPSISPGYWRQEEATRNAFDDEGYYRTGDALRFVDPNDPGMGLLFDGRIAEDFKLTTGTWVSVGNLRNALVSMGAPFLQDVVITGHDKDFVGAILFPNLEVCRTLCKETGDQATAGELLHHPAVLNHFSRLLAKFAESSTGSANRIARAVLTDTPASIDKGEITDKGSLNQRAVIRNRPELLKQLYDEPMSADVLHIHGHR